MGTILPRISIPQGTAAPCVQKLIVSSEDYDMREVTGATVSLVKSGEVVKSWEFSPDASTTETRFVGTHEFVESDTESIGIFMVVIELEAPGGSIPVKTVDSIRIFDPMREQ